MAARLQRIGVGCPQRSGSMVQEGDSTAMILLSCVAPDPQPALQECAECTALRLRPPGHSMKPAT
jgi:hypothetical protein